MKTTQKSFPIIFSSLIVLIMVFSFGLSAQQVVLIPFEHVEKKTVLFAVKDADTLYMDLYRLKENKAKSPVMMFQFGGSFMRGKRDGTAYSDYFQTLAQMGFTVASIDYRLGMKGKKYNLDAFISRNGGLSDAVQAAVEDLFSATDYLIDHAEELNINPDSISTSGSSAGAISALQADWILKNRMTGAEILPADFTYKGVIGFAGAIFSRNGGPKWKYGQPAPTLMFHGSKDRTVPYRVIRAFRLGMFPSKNLERRMRRSGAEYLFIDLKGKDHDYGANTVMTEGLFLTKWFLDEYIRSGNGRQLVFKVSDEF